MVDVAGASVLAVLTRAPSAGGKSRLFAQLGRPPDASLLEALLLDTIDGATTPMAHAVVAVTPASACDEVRALMGRLKAAPTIDVIPQPDGDLGERMRGTMSYLFDCGAHAVALIGSDLPAITPRPVAAAFELLAGDPDALVLGPAADGGYYLVAARRVPDVFSGIEWGSPRTLAQTQRAARAAGLHVRLLDLVSDVDTMENLRRLPQAGAARRTTAWLRRHLD
jgi:rSAM/selenodomain-associated transferase 1